MISENELHACGDKNQIVGVAGLRTDQGLFLKLAARTGDMTLLWLALGDAKHLASVLAALGPKLEASERTDVVVDTVTGDVWTSSGKI
jgi:hypothetical protein